MPPRGKKRVRPKRPYQKVQDFVDNYKSICTIYDVQPVPEVEALYGPIIEKKGRRIPQMLQFSETILTAIQLRPLIEAYKVAEIKIKFLSFLNTETGDDGMHVLAHAFEPPLDIAGIAYHANDVGPSGCRGFARSMVSSKTLAILELDFNPKISDDGILGLTSYGHCTSLTRLSLRFCDIGDEGAAIIGNWITQEGCGIKDLFLNGNKIGPSGAIAFAKGLAGNKSLNRIELQDNLFGFDSNALMALHDGIEACPTMQYVNLLSNFECPPGIDAKFIELTKKKPLGECLLTIKMSSQAFQSMRSVSLSNKRKMVKEAKRLAREARRNRSPSPSQDESPRPETPTIPSSRTNIANPQLPVINDTPKPSLSTAGTIP